MLIKVQCRSFLNVTSWVIYLVCWLQDLMFIASFTSPHRRVFFVACQVFAARSLARHICIVPAGSNRYFVCRSVVSDRLVPAPRTCTLLEYKEIRRRKHSELQHEIRNWKFKIIITWIQYTYKYTKNVAQQIGAIFLKVWQFEVTCPPISLFTRALRQIKSYTGTGTRATL